MVIKIDSKELEKHFIKVASYAFHARSNKTRLSEIYANIDQRIAEIKSNSKRNLSKAES